MAKPLLDDDLWAMIVPLLQECDHLRNSCPYRITQKPAIIVLGSQ